MFMPMLMSMQATNLAYSSAGLMFGANQARMGLANGVTGNESQAEVASLAAQDKALTFQGIQAQTNYQVSQAMLESAQNLKKKNQEQKERLMANGAIFV
jgi:hypothetical protein